MASEIEELVVKIAGDAKALEKALKQSEKAVKNFAQKTGASLKKVGKGMQNVGGAMTKYITAPLLAFAGIGIHAFAKFNDNMTKSTAIMRDEFGNTLSKEVIGKMEEAAILIGETTVTSSVDAAEAYFFLASAGLSAAQAIEALPIVNNLAIAGAFDLATATDLLTDAQSALGLMTGSTAQKMENMIRVSDVLVKANTMANATVAQFSTSLTSKAGAALKSFNKDVEEGVAVLAAMADQGVKAQLAGNNLNRMITLLGQAAQRNAADHKRLGFEVFDAAGKMNNLGQIIGQLEQITTDMTDEQLTATLAMLGFQAETQAVIMPLLGTSATIAEYEEALRSAGGMTEDVANDQMKSFSAQMKILWNQIRNLAMELGKKLAPAITWVAKKIQGAIEWYKKQSEWVKTTMFWVGVLAAALGPLLMIVGTLIVMIGGTVAAWGAMTAAMGATSVTGVILTAVQWALNAAMAAMPFAIFLMAAAAVIALSVWIYKSNKAMQDFNKEMERGKKLNDQLKEMREGDEKKVDKEISEIKDPKKKIEALNAELERSTKNMKGYQFQVKNSTNEAAKLAPTWKSGWQAGKKLHEASLVTLAESEERLENQVERQKELKEQLEAAKEEQAELNALQVSTGITTQQEMLLVSDQIAALNEMNDSLALQEQTVGMTKDEIELYKAAQAGANEQTMATLQAIADENTAMRESIKAKEKAAAAAKELEEKAEKAGEAAAGLTEKYSEQVAIFGMNSREAAIYKLEVAGATEADLEQARALDMKLTELEKNKKLMKQGEAITKKLRTEEQKLADSEKELSDMLAAGAIDLDTYERGMVKLHEETKKDFKVKFKVSGVEGVIAGTADAAARLEEFRTLAKKQKEDPPIDFRGQGQDIQSSGLAKRFGEAVTGTEADKALATAQANEKKRQEEEAAKAKELADAREAERKAAEDEIVRQVNERKAVSKMTHAQLFQVYGREVGEQIADLKARAMPIPAELLTGGMEPGVLDEVVQRNKEAEEQGTATTNLITGEQNEVFESRPGDPEMGMFQGGAVTQADINRMNYTGQDTTEMQKQFDQAQAAKAGTPSATPGRDAMDEMQKQYDVVAKPMTSMMTDKQAGILQLRDRPGDPNLKKTPGGLPEAEELTSMDEALQQINENTAGMQGQQLVVISPAEIS